MVAVRGQWKSLLNVVGDCLPVSTTNAFKIVHAESFASRVFFGSEWDFREQGDDTLYPSGPCRSSRWWWSGRVSFMPTGDLLIADCVFQDCVLWTLLAKQGVEQPERCCPGIDGARWPCPDQFNGH
ncbi:MAG: hypothetical protein ACK58L_16935 [Planctomycetota bacterium]